MFTTPEQIEVQILGGGAPRKATVRMPSDQQWIERQRKRPIEVRQLGRGRSETKVRECREEDLRIYNEIRFDGTPDLDQYKASAILSSLSRAELVSVERREDGYLVKIETVAGVLETVLKGPSAKDWQIYAETRSRVISGRNTTEIYVNLNAGANLFDACSLQPHSVPIIWKAAAASALIDEIEAGFAGDDQEDLFRE